MEKLKNLKNGNGNGGTGFEKIVFIPEKQATFQYFRKKKFSLQRREFDHYFDLKLNDIKKVFGDKARITKLTINIDIQKAGLYGKRKNV